jgi:uncharacterized lipoprotein
MSKTEVALCLVIGAVAACTLEAAGFPKTFEIECKQGALPLPAPEAPAGVSDAGADADGDAP